MTCDLERPYPWRSIICVVLTDIVWPKALGSMTLNIQMSPWPWTKTFDLDIRPLKLTVYTMWAEFYTHNYFIRPYDVTSQFTVQVVQYHLLMMEISKYGLTLKPYRSKNFRPILDLFSLIDALLHFLEGSRVAVSGFRWFSCHSAKTGGMHLRAYFNAYYAW